MFELGLKFLKYGGGIDYEKSEKVNLVYNDCRYSYSDYHIYCHLNIICNITLTIGNQKQM